MLLGTCEDMAFKDLLYLEKNITETVRAELTDVHKNLKKRSLDETKGKMRKIDFWLKEKLKFYHLFVTSKLCLM